MYKLGVTGLKCFLFAAGMLVYTSLGWATTNSCPNTTASSSVNNGPGGNTVTIPGAGPGNDFGTLGSGGCTAVDLNFSNFNNSTFTGAGMNGIETAAGTYMAETPAGTSNNPGTNPDVLLFGTVRGAANVGIDGNNNDGNNNWVVGHGNGEITNDITFNVANSGNNPGAAIRNIVLTAYDPNIDPSTSGTITLDICEGAAPNTQITTSAACTSAGGTAFVTSSLTLATSLAGTLTLSVPLIALPNAFDITTVIDLKNNGGTGHFAGLDAFSEEFDEGTPEPSTFVLMGTALAVIGALRLHARGKAAVRATD
jgi:hypothetical protein